MDIAFTGKHYPHAKGVTSALMLSTESQRHVAIAKIFALPKNMNPGGKIGPMLMRYF
jgi:hypothetical protein